MRIESALIVCLIFGLVQVSLAHRNRDGQGGRRRSRPDVECPALECPDSTGVCPYGWKHDENGCRLCECRTSWRCRSSEPQPTCRKHCENGFTVGADGCPTCVCYEPNAPSLLPAPATATGEQPQQLPQQPDRARPEQRPQGRSRSQPAAAQLPAVTSVTSDGDTSSPVCPPICMMYCQTGMKTDANGCPICECNDESSTSAEGGRRGRGRRPNRRRGSTCERPTCAMYCPNGYRRDQAGCTLCECHQPGDAQFQPSEDRSLQCTPLACHRRKTCAHGFASDPTSGCPSCVCRTAPGA